MSSKHISNQIYSFMVTNTDPDLNILSNQLVKDFESGNKEKWSLISKNKILKIWEDFHTTGDVSADALYDIYEQVLENLKKICAYSLIEEKYFPPEYEGDEEPGMTYWDAKKRSAWNKYTENKTTEYIEPFMKALEHLKKGTTPKDKLSAIKNVLNLNPGSGTAADWFIEGGTATLNSLKKYNKSAMKGLNMHAKTVVSNYFKSAINDKKESILVNLTPHPIKIHSSEGTITIESSGNVARVDVSESDSGDKVNGIPIKTRTTGKALNIPSPQKDTYYIVSSMVLASINRPDVIAPDTGKDAIRDEKGHIISVKAFVRSL